MIDYVKQRVSQDFQIHNIELVDVDQMIRPAEHGNALHPEDISIEQKYANKMDHLAFYIRPIEQITSNGSTISTACVICHDYENIRTHCFYSCQHRLCESCIVSSVQHNLMRCPICRSTNRSNQQING